MTKYIALLGMLLGASACSSEPVVGEWEHEDSDSSFEDTMTIEDDGTGTRLVEVTDREDGTTFYIKVEFDIEWTVDGDNQYEAEIECDDAKIKVDGDTVFSGCNDVEDALEMRFDVEADCEIENEGEELECEVEDEKQTYERMN
jgi:hypothetical protein